MKKKLYKGPDISYHNGNVDIKRVRDSGCKRVGIRCGYGKNNIDEKFQKNALACVNLGELVLLYWFSYALTAAMSAQEAQSCIAQAKKYWKSCPIAFDLEYDSIRYARTKGVNIDKQLATDMAVAFLKEVKEAGYIPVLYTNRDYLDNYFDIQKITEEVGKVYVWYARYTSGLSTSESEAADIWQYSSKGTVPGISGKADMNHFYTDFAEQEETVKPAVVCNINILNFQKAANADGYRDAQGRKLAEDGIDGMNTQYVRRQILLKAKKKGTLWKADSTGEVVRWWQTRCNEILGHSQEVDGKFGRTARSETMEVQKLLSLKVDGVAGYNSLQAAFYN